MNILRNGKALLITAALLAGSQPAQAQEDRVFCAGKVAVVGQNDQGVVHLEWEGYTDPVLLCSITTDGQGIAASTCRGWYSQILAGYGLGRQVGVWFRLTHPDNAGVTCAQASLEWKRRTPFYIELIP